MTDSKDDGWFEMAAWSQRLDAQLVRLHQRLDATDRRLDQRLAEIRAKQEEDLVLLKALSCQVRGRAERRPRGG